MSITAISNSGQTITATFGAPDVELVDHEMVLTLALKKHLKAKGSLYATDGYAPCGNGASVCIYRDVGLPEWKFVKGTTTNSFGSFSVKIKDRKGSYFAYVPSGTVDDANTCIEAYSDIRKHKH